MSSKPQGPSGNDGLSITTNHSLPSNSSTIEVNNNKDNVIDYPTTVTSRKQQTLLNLYSKLVPTTAKNVDTPHQLPSTHQLTPLPPPRHIVPSTSTTLPKSSSQQPSTFKTSTMTTNTHLNPYRPHRRKLAPRRGPVKPFNSRLQQSPPAAAEPIALPSPLPKSIPPATNPYRREKQPPTNPLTTQALNYCKSNSSSSSSDTPNSITTTDSLESLLVRRTRSRLVYRPDRLHCQSPGTPGRNAPPLLLPGLSHLSQQQQQDTISTMREIASLQQQIQEYENDSRSLLHSLNETPTVIETSMQNSYDTPSDTVVPPLTDIYIVPEHTTMCTATLSDVNTESGPVAAPMVPTEAVSLHSAGSISDISEHMTATSTSHHSKTTDKNDHSIMNPTEYNEDPHNDQSDESMTLHTPTRSETSKSTVCTLPSSDIKSTCTINNVCDVISPS